MQKDHRRHPASEKVPDMSVAEALIRRNSKDGESLQQLHKRIEEDELTIGEKPHQLDIAKQDVSDQKSESVLCGNLQVYNRKNKNSTTTDSTKTSFTNVEISCPDNRITENITNEPKAKPLPFLKELKTLLAGAKTPLASEIKQIIIDWKHDAKVTTSEKPVTSGSNVPKPGIAKSKVRSLDDKSIRNVLALGDLRVENEKEGFIKDFTDGAIKCQSPISEKMDLSQSYENNDANMTNVSSNQNCNVTRSKILSTTVCSSNQVSSDSKISPILTKIAPVFENKARMSSETVSSSDPIDPQFPESNSSGKQFRVPVAVET